MWVQGSGSGDGMMGVLSVCLSVCLKEKEDGVRLCCKSVVQLICPLFEACNLFFLPDHSCFLLLRWRWFSGLLLQNKDSPSVSPSALSAPGLWWRLSWRQSRLHFACWEHPSQWGRGVERDVSLKSSVTTMKAFGCSFRGPAVGGVTADNMDADWQLTVQCWGYKGVPHRYYTTRYSHSDSYLPFCLQSQ